MLLITSEEKIYSQQKFECLEAGDFVYDCIIITVTPIIWHNQFSVYDEDKIYEYGIVCHKDCYEILQKE